MGLSVDVRATFTAEGAESFTVDAAIEVERGERLVVLGPSGSGKTLLLETTAGFHRHEGTISFDGQDLADVPPEHRDFGFVFQDYALFPHMTVRENVEYGTKYHDDTRDPEVLLEELGVGGLVDRYPPTLSGGERQRVALARALAIEPSVMLLDEPLASLDVPTRQSLRDDLTEVLSDVTSVYVTHNRTTARAIADRIAVMRDGQIVQTGTPESVFEAPTSPMVADFTGANVIDLAAAPSLAALLDGQAPASDSVSIRPEALVLGREDGDIQGTVKRIVREDATNRVTVAFDEVSVETYTDQNLDRGEDVWLTVPADRVHGLE
jgi:ABC-type Fe3+/spermidine/putrescine transport system ATPase subunit